MRTEERIAIAPGATAAGFDLAGHEPWVGSQTMMLLAYVVVVASANLLVVSLDLGEISWRLVAIVLLVSLTAVAFMTALQSRLELRRLRTRRQHLFEQTERVLAQAQARARGETAPRSEALIDAELAQLRHRDLVRYGSRLHA